MSHCLDLFLPEVPVLPGLVDMAALVIGGEAAHPRKYRMSPDIELDSYPVEGTPYPFTRLLPAGYVGQDWRLVSVKCGSLYGGFSPGGSDRLEFLLRAILTSSDRWAVGLAFYCDQVDVVFPGSIDDVVARLAGVLTGRRREGFIGYLP